MDLRKSALFSGLAHLAIIILIIVGLPHIFQHELHPPRPIPIEIVNIADITQAKSLKAKPKPKGHKPVEEEKPTPPKPKPPTPPEEKVEEVKPEPLPEEKLIEDLLAEAEPLEKVEEEVKPKKEKKEKKKEKKKPEKDFMALLNNLENVEDSDASPAQKEVDEAATEDHAADNISDVLTVTELDLIRRQMRECWNVPSGTKGIEGMVVVIHVEMNPDATVRHTKLVDSGRYGSDPHFRAVADSALRAAKNPRCSPLKLPLDRYADWKSFTFQFDPKDMF